MTAARTADAYLSYLKAKPGAPSLDALQSLIRLHLQRIPFENISKFHYYTHRGTGLQWLPDIGTFLYNAEAKGFGGNCYILNAHFGDLLRQLGYEVEFVRATGGNTHLALMVTIAGRAYYVDVGYGAPLFEPICPEEQPRFFRYGEEVEITELGERQYRIDRRMNGQSFVTKHIEWKPVSLESFDEVITHSLRDEDDNPFMRSIRVTLFTKDCGYSVINQKLFVKSNQGTEVHEYERKREWLEMMRVTFGIQPDALEEALDFLGDRGVRLFG